MVSPLELPVPLGFRSPEKENNQEKEASGQKENPLVTSSKPSEPLEPSLTEKMPTKPSVEESNLSERYRIAYLVPPLRPHFPNRSGLDNAWPCTEWFSHSSKSSFETPGATKKSGMELNSIDSAHHQSISNPRYASHGPLYSQHMVNYDYHSNGILTSNEASGYNQTFAEHYGRSARQNSTSQTHQRSNMSSDRNRVHEIDAYGSNMDFRHTSNPVIHEQSHRSQFSESNHYFNDQDRQHNFEPKNTHVGSEHIAYHPITDSNLSVSGTRSGQERHNINRRRIQLTSPGFSRANSPMRLPPQPISETPDCYENLGTGHLARTTPSAQFPANQLRTYQHVAPPTINSDIPAHQYYLEASNNVTNAKENDFSLEEIFRSNRPRTDTAYTPQSFIRTKTLDFEGSRLRKIQENLNSKQPGYENLCSKKDNGFGHSVGVDAPNINSTRSVTEVIDLTTPVKSNYPLIGAASNAFRVSGNKKVLPKSNFTHKQAEEERRAAERIAFVEKRAQRIKNYDELFEESPEDEEAELRIKKLVELELGKKRVKEKAQLIDSYQKQMVDALEAKRKQEEREDIERRKAERKKKIPDAEKRLREEKEAERLEMKRVQSLKFSDRERRRHEAIMAKAQADAKNETNRGQFASTDGISKNDTGKQTGGDTGLIGDNANSGLFIIDDDKPLNEIINLHIPHGSSISEQGIECQEDTVKKASNATNTTLNLGNSSERISAEVSNSKVTLADIVPRATNVSESSPKATISADRASRTLNTATVKSTSVAATAKEHGQKILGANLRSHIRQQPATSSKEAPFRARKGWVGAREAERLDREYRQVLEKERKDLERMQEELLAQEEERQKDWEAQQEQRSNEWEAQMSQVSQMNRILSEKTETLLEMAVEKAVAKVATITPVITAAQPNAVLSNYRASTFYSTVTFVSQAAAQAEERRKAEDSRRVKYEKDRRKTRKRYERDIRRILDTQGMEQDEEKIHNTVEEKMQLWEEHRKKKDFKIFGKGGNDLHHPIDGGSGGSGDNQEASLATVHSRDNINNDDPKTEEIKKREAAVRAGVSFLSSMNKTSNNFAKAADRQHVDFLNSDESEESEEDPDDEPEPSQKPTTRGFENTSDETSNKFGRDVDGDVNMDLCPTDVDHRILPQLPSIPASALSISQHPPIAVENHSEADMIHAYKVRHLCERNGEIQPHVVLQTFHNLGEANAFAAQQLGDLYLSIDQALTGKSEMHDADNLYMGKITIQNQPDWAEMIFVTREITYIGDIVNLQREDVKSIIHPKVFNVIKILGHADCEMDIDIVASTSIKTLANKLAADEYLALAKPITASLDLVTHYRDVVVPDVRARLQLADELGEVVAFDPGVNGQAGLTTFLVSIRENAVRGPLN